MSLVLIVKEITRLYKYYLKNYKIKIKILKVY